MATGAREVGGMHRRASQTRLAITTVRAVRTLDPHWRHGGGLEDRRPVSLPACRALLIALLFDLVEAVQADFVLARAREEGQVCQGGNQHTRTKQMRVRIAPGCHEWRGGGLQRHRWRRTLRSIAGSLRHRPWTSPRWRARFAAWKKGYLGY